MFRKLFFLLVIAIIGLVVYVAMQPEDFKFSRTATVAAPPPTVFAAVNDFHQWEKWSPWAKLDPSMTTTYEGPATGEGAVYGWSSTKVGSGKMTLTKSVPSQQIAIQLDFLKPMKATNLAEFTFKPVPAGTEVTWTMSGKKGFLSKGFDRFVGIEKKVAPDFEKGLAALKTQVEGEKK